MPIAPPHWMYAAAEDDNSVARETLTFWHEYAPQLEAAGRLTPLDVPAFTTLALCWGNMIAAQQELMLRGILVKADRGGPDVLKKSGAAQVFKDNSATFTALCAKFGMTPDARGRMHIRPETVDHGGVELD